ncbi:signal recognition particle-docking protein FtsY [Candidatus Phytoplasma sacchari]|uniref:Signal recognition particle-docking protein FtsY n=1 Tax=Candidatus Phytoplasma sacchari TaxID=2609813 RepID=A0ABY7M4V8_9MOLU|nr:signal recognition particle-docking protein FtsY [Candidatus Phytoplasma sacchari]
MFDFLKKIFKNKQTKKKHLGFQSLDYDFKEWIKKNNNSDILSNLRLLDELEIFFIKFGMGIETSSYLIQNIKNKVKEKNINFYLLDIIKEIIIEFYNNPEYKFIKDIKQKKNISKKEINTKTQLYLFVGVNGVGKTTTIGKLAYKFKKNDKKVLLVAGDIFRDGAIEQLRAWSKITNSDIFWENNAKKSSKIFFDAIKYAENKEFDFILSDTSGRLQNNVNLMKELEKINKILDNNSSFFKNNYRIFLVIDSMTGHNALNQVELFNKILPINDIILTKFDNISKAGIILDIKYLYNLKIKYIGIGEKEDDLIEFNIKDFVDNLLD